MKTFHPNKIISVWHILFTILIIMVLPCLTSCSDDRPIADKPSVKDFFGGEDLYYEIPAEGGRISIFPENGEIPETKGAYLIDQPLNWFESFEQNEKYWFCGTFYRGDFQTLAYLSAYGPRIPDDVTVYQFENGYTFKGREYEFECERPILLYYNSDRYYHGTAGWLEIHIYKDHTEVIAPPNDSGKERYISFIFDQNSYPSFLRGAIEVKQPAK